MAIVGEFVAASYAALLDHWMGHADSFDLLDRLDGSKERVMVACGSCNGTGSWIAHIDAEPACCVSCGGTGLVDPVERPFATLSFPRILPTKQEFDRRQDRMVAALKAAIDEMCKDDPSGA